MLQRIDFLSLQRWPTLTPLYCLTQIVFALKSQTLPLDLGLFTSSVYPPIKNFLHIPSQSKSAPSLPPSASANANNFPLLVSAPI